FYLPFPPAPVKENKESRLGEYDISLQEEQFQQGVFTARCGNQTAVHPQFAAIEAQFSRPMPQQGICVSMAASDDGAEACQNFLWIAWDYHKAVRALVQSQGRLLCVCGVGEVHAAP